MDICSQILARYESLRLHEVNEAQTRIEIIQRVLIEVLDWQHSDITVEVRVSEDGKQTFADFVVRTAVTGFVIEAKKIGRTFTSRDVTRNKKKIKLGTLSRLRHATEPVRQARDYARKLGLPFAIVTNGNQWILFPATRTDQVSFENSNAIIFNSLRDILEKDHDEFRALLSRESVIKGSLENALLGRIDNQIEERRLNKYYPHGTIRPTRTNLFPLIQSAIEIAFSEEPISEDSDLLEKCYVSTPDRTRFDSRIQMHIAARSQPVTGARVSRPMKPRERRALNEIIDNATSAFRPVTVLVLGVVGTGKTTFLTYTHKVSGKERFTPSNRKAYPHWLYVDFRSFVAQSSPYDYICSSLKESIAADSFLSDGKKCVDHAYKEDIEGLSRGPLHLLARNDDEWRRRISDYLLKEYEATNPYVEKILAYASRNTGVFLVIDNVDQVEPELSQTRIFSDAMALARRIGCNLILAMRDGTFVKNRNNPIFNAFDFDTIYIDAPKIDAVLSKRFFVAKQKLNGVQGQFDDPSHGSVHVHDLSIIIDLVQSSVLGTEIGTLIEVFSASDVRLALRMTREFLQNGYTATARALEIFEREGRYTMPKHDALRAVILGSRNVYEEESSLVGNPFDARLARTEAQLLRLYVLAALVASASDNSFQSMEGIEIAKHLKQIGFGEDVCLAILIGLCERRFVQTLGQATPALDANFNPTRLGGYIVRHLIGNFTFMQHMMMDTFISDEQVWTNLRQLMTGVVAEKDVLARMDLRAAAANAFFDYLRSRYDPIHEHSVAQKLPAQWCTHPLKAIDSVFRSDVRAALRSANNNYGPNGRLAHFRYLRAEEL
jgi:hypothetical protein